MAQFLNADDIDFTRYLIQTDVSVKLRPASDFLDALYREFLDPVPGVSRPHMSSTKLRSTLDFRPGEVTAWAGYNGHRKSLFIGQVALDLCAQEHRLLIISLEMQPTMTLARMLRQACAKLQPSTREIAAFASWTDDRLWIFDHLGRLSTDKCASVCRYFAAERAGTQVVIDSMMMICESEEHLDEQKKFTTALVRLAQETGLHIHLLAHCRKPQSGDESRPPSKYDLRGSASISDQAHNVITIWANKAKKAALELDPDDEKQLEMPDAAVTVEKQRNGAWEGRVKLWFDETSLRFSDDRISQIHPYDLFG